MNAYFAPGNPIAHSPLPLTHARFCAALAFALRCGIQDAQA